MLIFKGNEEKNISEILLIDEIDMKCKIPQNNTTSQKNTSINE